MINLNKRKLELILAFGLFLFFIGAWTILIIKYYELKNWGLWVVYFFLVNSSIVVIWKSIAKWIRDFNRENKEKVGKKLEFFFFAFLFLSTYFLCFISAKYSLIFMSILFSISVISALYCGWFHYFEEINKPESISAYHPEKYFSDFQYISVITVVWSTLLILFFIFLLR